MLTELHSLSKALTQRACSCFRALVWLNHLTKWQAFIALLAREKLEISFRAVYLPSADYWVLLQDTTVCEV